jgi:hypothetical protein
LHCAVCGDDERILNARVAIAPLPHGSRGMALAML